MLLVDSGDERGYGLLCLLRIVLFRGCCASS